MELTITPEPIHEYCKKCSTPPDPLLSNLIKTTRDFAPSAAHMQVGHLEGKLLQFLVQLMSARSILEFGTFTGYSALAMAEALPENGSIFTLDRDPKATEIAQQFWNQSPHGKKIQLILGDARSSLAIIQERIKNHNLDQFDLVFIDADKGSYEFYYEQSLGILRTGGCIVIDNVLWSGKALDPQAPSDHTLSRFNEKIRHDPRVDKLMLPIRDGITILIKR